MMMIIRKARKTTYNTIRMSLNEWMNEWFFFPDNNNNKMKMDVVFLDGKHYVIIMLSIHPIHTFTVKYSKIGFIPSSKKKTTNSTQSYYITRKNDGTGTEKKKKKNIAKTTTTKIVNDLNSIDKEYIRPSVRRLLFYILL